ncbi:MAG: LCP family protein [Caldisericia bacterium]
MQKSRITKRKRKSIIPIVVILLVMLTFIGATYAVSFYWKIQLATKVEYVSRSEPLIMTERMNLLLLAVDAPSLQEPARADSIKVISIDPKEYTVNMISIPRDSYVAPAGFRPDDRIKINAINNPATNPLYGTDRLIETIEEIMGIKIHGFAKINFNGFIDVIDSIGGMDIYVEENMYKDGKDFKIDIKKGLHHLNGENALKYVRYRSNQYGDWAPAKEGVVRDRTGRQTKFIKAVIKEATKPSNWGNSSVAIEAITKNILTDIPMAEIWTFADILRHVKPDSIKDIPFPATYGDAPGFYYKNGERIDTIIKIVEPDLKKLKKLGQEYFSDEQ